ncbi:MAG: GlsB/YeaQ/YmgE family stress response membrane protein [Ilumatobacteraceae bacterium]
MFGFILFLLIVGLIAGFLARALVPGRDPMSVGQTLVLGIVGSFIGGFVGYLLFRKDSGEGAFQASGIIGSIVGAVIALLIWRAVQSRSTTGIRHHH